MDAGDGHDGHDGGGYEDFFSAELFLNQDYVAREFSFGDGVRQQLLCSTAASTDHDLTGQVVWPVSVFLAWFLAARRAELAGKTVVELGAGAGLSGLVASKFAARTALTDGNDIVLKLLDDNARENGGACVALPLLWGEQASVVAFEERFPHPVDVIIGADVVCWPMLVTPILQTIKYLMLKARAPLETVFYCGFVCRAQSTEDQFFREARAAGFRFERVADSSFLPDPRPADVTSQRELQLLAFRLDPLADNWDSPVVFADDAIASLQTAC